MQNTYLNQVLRFFVEQGPRMRVDFHSGYLVIMKENIMKEISHAYYCNTGSSGSGRQWRDPWRWQSSGMLILHCIKQFMLITVGKVTWPHLRWGQQWQVRNDTLSGTQISESDVIKHLCLASWLAYLSWHFIHLYLFPGMDEIWFLEAVIFQLKRTCEDLPIQWWFLYSYWQELIEAKCIICYWTRRITCKYINQC